MVSFKNIFIPKRNISPKNIYFILLYLIFLIQIKSFNSQCTKDSIIKDGSQCFNRIIRFVPYYRGGQFTIRKDGVLFIEYSSVNKRLFYSLKTNGRGYFPNDATYKEIEIQSNIYVDNNLINSRLESKNILIYLTNDSEQKNPYIFSVSAFKSVTELHRFDNEGNNNHSTWLTTNFFNTENHRIIFSYQFSLLEGYNNIYYASYIQYKGTNDGKDFSESYTLSKFKFNGINNKDIIFSKEFNDNYDNRIVSAFILDKYYFLAVCFLKRYENKYKVRLHNLDNFNIIKEEEIYYIGDKDAFLGEGIFFKSIHVCYEYFAFIFFRKRTKVILLY